MNVTLEFAHAQLGNVNWSDVERSCETAQAVAEKVNRSGHRLLGCVLIDDKKVDPDTREVEAKALLSKLHGPRISFYCFERDLECYADDLIALVPGSHKRRTMRDIRSWVAKYNALPCSVDIAIWHLLRLGLIEDHANRIQSPSGRSDVTPGDVVMSVLGDQLSEYEVIARQRYLDHIPGLDASSCIFNLYYPETRSSENASVAFDSRLPANLEEVLDGHDLDN